MQNHFLISDNLNWQYESHLTNCILSGSLSKIGLSKPFNRSDSLKLIPKQELYSLTITGIPIKVAYIATWLL